MFAFTGFPEKDFRLGDRSGQRIYLSQSMFEIGKADLAEYIYLCLQEHVVVKEIYLRIEDKSITRWGVGEIIPKLSRKRISKKTEKDYHLSIFILAEICWDFGKTKERPFRHCESKTKPVREFTKFTNYSSAIRVAIDACLRETKKAA